MNVVQVGGDRINNVVTSKEAILHVCREIVAHKGLQMLNMRSVAQACHIALGSVYNYFSNKDELVLATIESVWQDIFHMECACRTDLAFPEYVSWVFESVRKGAMEYPNFFTAHSLSFASTGKNKARDTMKRYFSHIKMGMEEALNMDASVRKDAFSPAFTKLDFIDFVLLNLLMLLMQQKNDCDMLREMIQRIIY